MSLVGLEILCGGPIKNLFSPAMVFDSTMRDLVERTVTSLSACGAVVRSAHIAEGFAVTDLSSRDITTRDHSWCETCDIYVALWPTGPDGLPFPSAGTAIELGWVSSRGKPIVMVWDEERSSAYSHLLRGLEAITAVECVDLRHLAQDAQILPSAIDRARTEGVSRAHSRSR